MCNCQQSTAIWVLEILDILYYFVHALYEFVYVIKETPAVIVLLYLRVGINSATKSLSVSSWQRWRSRLALLEFIKKLRHYSEKRCYRIKSKFSLPRAGNWLVWRRFFSTATSGNGKMMKLSDVYLTLSQSVLKHQDIFHVPQGPQG